MNDLVIPGPDWAADFKWAVFFIAGHYAAEKVRERQQWAHNRGSTLSQAQIADIFRQNAEYMSKRIQETSLGADAKGAK